MGPHPVIHDGKLYLSNGDILLSGARNFDAENPWPSDSGRNAELWVRQRVWPSRRVVRLSIPAKTSWKVLAMTNCPSETGFLKRRCSPSGS